MGKAGRTRSRRGALVGGLAVVLAMGCGAPPGRPAATDAPVPGVTEAPLPTPVAADAAAAGSVPLAARPTATITGGAAAAPRPTSTAPPVSAGAALGGLRPSVAAAQGIRAPAGIDGSGVRDVAGGPAPARAAAAPVAPTQPPRRAYRLPMQGADVAPEPAPGAPRLVASPALATLVQQHLGGLRGVFGVAVKTLGSGEGALLNADREFPAASLFKLPVMYEVYRQRDAGRLDLGERLVLTQHYADLDLGTLDLPVGTSVNITTALERMIAISDNATANLLADRVSWSSLNATTHELGLDETHLGGDRLTTSPRDMLRLLEMIARGGEPTPASANAMIDLLLAQRVNDRLPAQLPPGTRVAHKTGNLGGIIHDVGIVYAPEAPFVIALLAEDAWDYREVATAQAALTRAVYDHLVTAAAAPTASPTPTATPTPTPVPPRPTARRWEPPPSPIVLPTAQLWRSPTPTATSQGE